MCSTPQAPRPTPKTTNFPVRCWNCWDLTSTHAVNTCPRPKLSFSSRERLRIHKGIRLPDNPLYKRDSNSQPTRDRECYNCWNSTTHCAWACPEVKRGVEEKEALRVKMGRPVYERRGGILKQAGITQMTGNPTGSTTKKQICTVVTAPPPTTSDAPCFNCWRDAHACDACPLPLLSSKDRELLRLELKKPMSPEWQAVLDLPTEKPDTPPQPPLPAHVCTNCWKSAEHTGVDCPKPTLSVAEREELRRSLNIPSNAFWQISLNDAGIPAKVPAKFYEQQQTVAKSEEIHHCFNCWNVTTHNARNCPNPKLSIVQSEALRYKKGAPAYEMWSRIIRAHDVHATEKVQSRMCYNCWSSDGHEMRNCPAPKLHSIEAKEALRGKLGKPLPDNWRGILHEAGVPIFCGVEVQVWKEEGAKYSDPWTSYNRSAQRNESGVGAVKKYYCFNCWELCTHHCDACPETRLSPAERDMLRYQKQIPVFPSWRTILDNAGYVPIEEPDNDGKFVPEFVPENKAREVQLCWNCWSPHHIDRNCPDPRRTIVSRELLRVKIGAVKPSANTYNELLASVTCFNCWSSYEHDAAYCTEVVRTDVEREEVRVMNGIAMCKRWRERLGRFRVGDGNSKAAELFGKLGEEEKSAANEPEKGQKPIKNAMTSTTGCRNCFSKDHVSWLCTEYKPRQHEMEENRVQYILQAPNAACFNCWSSYSHEAKNCPEVQRKTMQREEVRVRKGVALCERWEDILKRVGIKPEILGKEDEPDQELSDKELSEKELSGKELSDQDDRSDDRLQRELVVGSKGDEGTVQATKSEVAIESQAAKEQSLEKVSDGIGEVNSQLASMRESMRMLIELEVARNAGPVTEGLLGRAQEMAGVVPSGFSSSTSILPTFLPE